MKKILYIFLTLLSVQVSAQIEQPKIKLNQIIKDTIGGRFLMSSFIDSNMTYESILTTDGTSLFLNDSLLRSGYWENNVDYLNVTDTLLPIQIPIIDDDSINISDNISGNFVYGVPFLNGSVPPKSGILFFDPAGYLSVTVAPPNVGTIVGSRGVLKYVAPDFQEFSQQYTSYDFETITTKWYVDQSINQAKQEILFNDIIQDAGIDITKTGDSLKISIDTIYIVTTAALLDSIQNLNPSLLLDNPNYIYQLDSIKTLRLNNLEPDSINLTGTPPGTTGSPNFAKIVDPREGQVFYDANDITGNTTQIGKGAIKYVATSADLTQFRIETLVNKAHLGSVLNDYVTLVSNQTITGEKTFTANTIFDDSTIVVDVTNHRVGFNTTSPINTIDINGIASSSEGFSVYSSLINSNYGFSNSWSNGVISLGNSFLLYGPSASGTFLGQSLAGNSVLRSSSSSLLIGSEGVNTNTILGAGGSEIIRIAYDGNVGIGTTNPTEKLSIVGKIKLNDGDDNVVVADVGGTNLISTSGLGNVLVGVYTGTLLEDGDYNVAIGHHTLFWNVSGSDNVAIGRYALDNNLANNNIAIGGDALAGNTTGTNNIGIGIGAGAAFSTGTLTSGTGNMFIGNATRASANGVSNEVVIGTNAVGNGSNTVTLGASNILSLHTGNYEFNTDQVVGVGTDNYVLTYDNTGGQISLEDVTTLIDTSIIATTAALNDSLANFTGGGTTSSINQETFISDGIQSSYTTTLDLPTDVSNIIVTHNGLTLDDGLFTLTAPKTINLGYVPDAGSRITIMWFSDVVTVNNTGTGVYQQQFTSDGIDSSYTINNVLPSNSKDVIILQNGVVLDNTFFTVLDSTVTLNFLPPANDKITVIYFTGYNSITGNITQTGGDVNFDNGTLFIDDSLNNVGIGTITPEYSLDIQGVSPVLRIADNRVANAADASAIWMGENGPSEVRGAGIVYNGSSNTLNLVTSNNGILTDDNPFNAAVRVTIQETTGNVGIGTTTPNSKLEIIDTTGGFSSALRITKGQPGKTGVDGYGYKNALSVLGYSSDPTNIDRNLTLAIMQLTNENNNYANISFFNTNGSNQGGFGMQFIDHTNRISNVYIATANGGSPTTKMTVTSDGKVGIGTTSPTTKLDVNGETRIGSSRRTIIGGALGTNYIQGSSGGWGLSWSALGSLGTDKGGYGWYGNNDNLYYYWIGPSTFSPHMVILDNGNVSIGTTSSSYKLRVNGSVAGVGGYVNLSDEFYKKNVYAINYGINELKQLRPVRFNWINPDYGTRTNLGFIAQEVELVMPEVVITAADGVKSMASTDLIPVLTKAIQEQQDQIDQLQQQIQLLIAEINALKNN